VIKSFLKPVLWLLIISNITLKAGVDCPSSVPAHMKPIWDGSNFSWAVEGTFGIGVINDVTIMNQMLVLGAAYQFGSPRHRIYFEGVGKGWYNSEEGDNLDYDRNIEVIERDHIGVRELNYKYSGKETSLAVGLQTMGVGDYFLMDERALAINYGDYFGKLNVNASVGTVMRHFARQRSVCALRHLYNISGGGKYGLVGKGFGETNFLAATAKWLPNREVKKDGEESADEFEEVTDDNSKSIFEEAGLIFYEEFGRGFSEYKYYAGAFTSVNLPFESLLRFETVYQYIPNERCFAYYADIYKGITWDNNSSTGFAVGGLGKSCIDNGVYFYPSFSNLYIGEVMRLDDREIPIVYAAVKHKFPWKNKLVINFQAMTQLEDVHTSEIDLEFVCRLFGFIKWTNTFSMINSNALDETYYMARTEIRLAY